MKLGFNEATSKGCSDLETDIILCAAAGFDFIELRLDMMQEYLKEHSPEDIVALLKENKIKPHALNAIYTYSELFGENDEPERCRSFLELYTSACRWASEIGSHYLIVVPPMGQNGFLAPYGKSRGEAEADFVRIVRELAQIADAYRVNLCLEPVGAPKSSIRTVSSAGWVIREAGKKNIGIVLDAYNLYMAYMDSRFDEIALLDQDRIFAVHINNADLGDPGLEKRRFCDSGVIDLGKFLGELKKKEYSGMVSVETFRPEYWQQSAEETIRQAYRTTREALERYECLDG